MNDSREAYEKKIAQKNKESRTPASEPTMSENFAAASKQAGASMASDSAQQGDTLGTMGGAAMMSGNPYLAAAGLGLQVYAAGEKNKRAEEERQRQEYNARIERRQEMMVRMAQMGIQ